MTATETAQGASVQGTARRGNPWRPSLRGVALVTHIELLRRRPSTKGYFAYGTMLAIIIGLGLLVSVMSPDGKDSTPLELVLMLVLGAGLLIGPSLSATSINGDSSEGVLAPLQMTRLTAGDIAFGKLIASWFVSFAMLVTTTPVLLYAFSRSGWHWGELLIVLAVILFVVLASSAVGLAWSAIAARAVASVSLAHLTTGFLVLGSLVLFAFSGALVSDKVVDKSRYIDWEQLSAEQQTSLDAAYMSGDFSDVDVDSLACVEETYERGVAHTEKTAWLLLVNPAVMIGEFSPIVNPTTFAEDGRAAPGIFAQIHQGVSGARIGPSAQDLKSNSYDDCANIAAMAAGNEPDYGDNGQDWEALQLQRATYNRAPWLGLGVQAVLLISSMTLVVRRLRVPYKKLRAGTRVA